MARRSMVGSPRSTGALSARVRRLSGAILGLRDDGAFGGGDDDEGLVIGGVSPLGEPLGTPGGQGAAGGGPPPPSPVFGDPQRGAAPAWLVPLPQRVSTRPLRISDFTLPTGTWTALTVERPTVLWPRAYVGAIIRYAPENPGKNETGSAVTLGAVRSGIVYLAPPGTWYLRQDSGSSVTFAVYDASDPGVAVRYLAEPGNQALVDQVIAAGSIGTSAVGTSGQLAAASRDRTGIIVSNNDPSVALLVALDTVAGGLYAAGTNAVLTVKVGETLELFGDQCFRSNLVAWWSGAAVGTIGPSVFQFF